MTTDVVHSIGATNSPVVMDYSTVESWAAACPVDLRAGSGTDQQWIGEVYNQGELATATQVSITTNGDTAHRVILRAAAGQGFADHPSAATNPLRYDPAVGAAMRGHHYARFIQARGQPWIEIARLQIRFEGYAYAPVMIECDGDGCGAAGIDVHDNILSISVAAARLLTTYCDPAKITNCVCISETTGTPVIRAATPAPYTQAAFVAVNCTFVSAGGSTIPVFNQLDNGYVTVTNCGFFGIAPPLTFATTASGAASANNITDQANFGPNIGSIGATGAAFTTLNFLAVSGVTNGAGTGLDLRIPLTSALLNNGSGITFATTDILGTHRPQGGSPDIGAYELPQAPLALPQSRAILFGL